MKSIVWIASLILLIASACKKQNVASPSELGEGGSEGGNESGILWNVNDTANEIVNGLNLILYYNPLNQSFEGTLENRNTTTAPLTRVEVHVFDAANNSKEYGPTPSVDMAPGTKRNVSLSVAGAGAFVKFNMHPEVGTASSGG